MWPHGTTWLIVHPHPLTLVRIWSKRVHIWSASVFIPVRIWDPTEYFTLGDALYLSLQISRYSISKRIVIHPFDNDYISETPALMPWPLCLIWLSSCQFPKSWTLLLPTRQKNALITPLRSDFDSIQTDHSSSRTSDIVCT